MQRSIQFFHLPVPKPRTYATVLEGAIRSQVKDGPVTTYEAGQSSPSCPATAMSSAPMPARRSRLARRDLAARSEQPSSPTRLALPCTPGKRDRGIS